jgi:glycosyltransferase involved in cell wall biosynthesis
VRILHVHTINSVANLYAQGLAHRGHSSTIYEPSLAGGSASLPIKMAMMPGRIFSLRHIVGYLNWDQFDIVHIHWASYGALGLLSRIPFVVHCHGSDVRNRLQTPFFRLMLAPVFHRAAAVLCITPDLLPVVRSLRSDARFCPAPVDTAHFVPPEARAPQPWTVLLFTRLEPGKGVAVATEGIARFAGRHPEVRVLLLDYGVLSATYRQRYGARFAFVPRVTPERIRHLIWQADAVVGQFAVGALGLSELQAMSCAKPVIASFRYPEAYPTPPPICQATTPDEVDAHLERLFSCPQEAIAMGRCARDWVVRYHDCHSLAIWLESLYRSLALG